MGNLSQKRIVLGVTGGIAAYKAAELIRRLRDNGAEVRVIMTASAQEFITPLTLQTLSGHPVHTGLMDPEAENSLGHIDLARWADALLIAPATANVLAKLAHGRADDLLTTVALATTAPLAVAPSMNRQMWDNTVTRQNIKQLEDRGVRRFGPGSGDQACGEVGEGRMLEPAELVEQLSTVFETHSLSGTHVVITAGPTWEAIDPVRGLTNHSSGKMGYAIAEAAVEAGARVTLISGPTALDAPERIERISVQSARDMLAACQSATVNADIFIATAAVADYRPAHFHDQKLKKGPETLTLELVRNPDILATIARQMPRPFCVGFAAETEHLESRARDKLRAKGIDLIAANDVSQPGQGFGSDDNALLLIDEHGQTELARQPKDKLARQLIEEIAKRYHAKDSTQDTRHANR